MEFIDYTIGFPVIFWVYIAAITIQLAYYWAIFGRFAFHKKKDMEIKGFPVSVVICAKNEYHNLKENLPLILDQDYPKFEVVVVNDASDDETIFLLEDLEREYKHIKIVNLSQDLNFFSGKKFPLALGIKSATYEHLLLTDADCRPTGRNWIKRMSGDFSKKKEIVLGYGKYKADKGFLNKIVRYETAITAIQYFSYAIAGMPYMGVGRNLAYAKSLFIKNKGFISHYNVASGDDDLFINQVAKKLNTAVEYHPDSFTYSAAKSTFKEWWIQKKRHLSVGKYYKLRDKVLLGTYSISFFVVILLFLFLLTLKIQIWIVISAFVFRLFSQIIILKKSFLKLEEKKLLLISPIIEVILLLLYPVIYFSNLISRQNRWK
ncbi:MAG: glycosyl transferase family 2 [Bacteroidetes bacterium]|nr:MAG: glycosyl transferase family 2 [Bacteroidota bacterium]